MYVPVCTTLIPRHETPSSRFNRDVHRLISLDVISITKHESKQVLLLCENLSSGVSDRRVQKAPSVPRSAKVRAAGEHASNYT